ncbi:MAG TPA: DUF1801 domain-containing protein [Candidatus Dormibacteraeota bacterium]
MTAKEVEARIRAYPGWQGKKLAQLRTVIKKADPDLVEELKWKKPSNPDGVPVWSHDGIVCVGEALKNAVRLTFPKGSSLKDPKKLFNARLVGKTRAIDFGEDDAIEEASLKALIVEAVKTNTKKAG